LQWSTIDDELRTENEKLVRFATPSTWQIGYQSVRNFSLRKIRPSKRKSWPTETWLNCSTVVLHGVVVQWSSRLVMATTPQRLNATSKPHLEANNDLKLCLHQCSAATTVFNVAGFGHALLEARRYFPSVAIHVMSEAYQPSAEAEPRPPWSTAFLVCFPLGRSSHHSSVT